MKAKSPNKLVSANTPNGVAIGLIVVVRVAVVQVHVPSVGGIVRILRRRPKVACCFRQLFLIFKRLVGISAKKSFCFILIPMRCGGTD